MKAYVTRQIPEVALHLVRDVADTEVWPREVPPSRGTLAAALREADGLLCLLTDSISADVLAGADHLRVVSQMAVGYDNIDVATCRARGIAVGYTPGVLTETTADLAFTLLLSAARRIIEADRYTRSGDWKTWSPMLLTGYDAHHATIGIVGMGRIGFEVARRARGFEMTVLYCDAARNEMAEKQFGAKKVDMPELLAESDFVTLHTPLTPETRHMIGAAELALMKPSAVLVNSSRGPIVDEIALYEALRSRTIAAAGLDVYEEEPLSVSSPLMSLDNVVLLPHIGSASIATRTKMAVLAAENLVAGLQGKPLPNPVP